MADRNSKTIAQEFIDNNNYGSVITIIMIIGIIIQVMKLLESCNTKEPESLYGIMRKNTAQPGWFTKMRLKKILRQKLPKEVYKEYSNKLMSDLLAYSQTIEESDFNCLMEEAI